LLKRPGARPDENLVHGYEDPGYLRFRRNSVKVGSVTAVTASAMVVAYLVATWHDRPNRGAIAVLLGVALLAVVLINVLRADRVVETRWCDAFFGVWSGMYVVIITALALLDGGGASPLAATFFPVLVFAGLCYPVRLAILVGAGCVAGDLVAGLAKSGHALEVPLYVAGCLALTAVMCAWQAHTLERHRRELARASRTDHLTGSLNRRGFHEHAQAELSRAFRSGEPVALVLVDLDGFKAVNDAHGHAAGDELLCWVVDRLRTGLRPSDAAGRLGGDEFALLLPGLDVQDARPVAERLRTLLAERTSASFGIAAYPAGSDAEALLALADAELYREKGRRRPAPDLSRVRLHAAESFWY
jgi:diguanylate cyclase (GGDEF)-like protein